MRKLTTIISLILVVIMLTACNNDYTVDYGESEIYTKEDMDSAISVILREFFLFDRNELLSLTYSGDEYSIEELSYCNQLKDDKDAEYTQCIVFKSSWRNTKKNSPVFHYNEIISCYEFHLARTDDGKWNLISQGYP